MRYPIDEGQYWVSNGFQSGHLALDLAANAGVAVKAPENGVVVGVNTNPTAYFGGMYVVIAGDSGHRHYLGHHSAVHVGLNQRVSEGQHIANVGSTGQATGPHVHWEVTRNGAAVNPATIANKSQGSNGLMIIQNAENWYQRCNKTHLLIRGRELARSTFNAYVGRDFLHFVEACSDDPEADRVQTWQNVGRIAVQDNWQNQIYTLQDQVKALNKRPTEAQVATLNKQVDTLSKSAQEATTEAKKQAEIAKAASDKVEKITQETAQAKKEADNFLTALLNSIRNMFGNKS